MLCIYMKHIQMFRCEHVFFCQDFRDFSVHCMTMYSSYVYLTLELGQNVISQTKSSSIHQDVLNVVYNTASNSFLYIPSTFILHHDLEKAASSSCCLFMNSNSCFKMWMVFREPPLLLLVLLCEFCLISVWQLTPQTRSSCLKASKKGSCHSYCLSNGPDHNSLIIPCCWR